jgi:hypothetical protein
VLALVKELDVDALPILQTAWDSCMGRAVVLSIL